MLFLCKQLQIKSKNIDADLLRQATMTRMCALTVNFCPMILRDTERVEFYSGM